LEIDGTTIDPSTGAGSTFILHEDSQSRYDPAAMTFVDCQDDTLDLNRHAVTFDGGTVEVELWLGDSFDITGPCTFARAAGVLDGVPFDVVDFFRLAYRPGHHHFDRHFAIVFDEPIGAACALRVEEVDDLEGTTTAVVSLAACDLGVIETRATLEESWVVE
jgi:hypothetical protein